MRTRLCIVAGGPELAHAGVDERHTRCCPRCQAPRARRTSARGHGNASNSGRQFLVASSGEWKSRCQENSRQPSSVQEAVRAARHGHRRLAERVPDLVRAELAPAQVRREPRRHRARPARRGRRRTRRGRRRGIRAGAHARPRSPGVHASRRPPAQSGMGGQQLPVVEGVAREHPPVSIASGAGSGCRGSGAARQARQNGVNT